MKNINPYLVEGNDFVVSKSSKNLFCPSPISYGSFALDDGNFTLSESDKDLIISSEPKTKKFIRSFIGSEELINSKKRFCLWLLDANPSEINQLKKIRERVLAVKEWRNQSERMATKKLAETPTVFAEIRQPNTRFLAIPTLSSVRRRYIPIGFLEPEIIASNQLYIVPNADLFTFGVITSEMHMDWLRQTGGTFKSDYRYSSTIVYNNFPFPQQVDPKQKKKVETAAQAVLDTRAKYPDSSLADLYDPLTMPPDLVKAHQALDKAVDL